MASVLAFLSILPFLAFSATKDEVVVLVVDPSWDDTAGYYNHVALLREYKIVKVMTHRGKSFSYVGGHIDLYRRFTYNADVADAVAGAYEVCPKLQSMGVPIAAVIPTSDDAVELTDQLAACVKVRGNPAFGPLAAARRDKWIMGEAVRKAGLRSVRQKRVTTWVDAQTFLESWEPPLSHQNPCVFKVLTGSGGQGDVEVKDMEQARAEWLKYPPGVKEILIQEYLKGREYAVDSVSRDGVHKVIAVWFEDFRPANGIFDQYFGFKLLDPESTRSKAIIKYANKILDATGVQNGATNTEVKWLEDEDQACLVEVNARWAGVNWEDGLAVEKACVGQDQITAAFSAYLDQDLFDQMPSVRPRKQNGAVVFTVNYQAGVLTAVPGLDEVKKYPSYLNSDVDSATGLSGALGRPIELTTPSTIPVVIALAHEDSSVVDADYDRIIRLEKANRFFQITPLSFRGSLTSARIGNGGVTGLSLQACVALATFSLLGVGAIVMNVLRVCKREEQDGTEYLAVE